MPIAIFGPKVFEVSGSKVNTFDGYSYQIGLNTESQELEGQKPSTWVKGHNLDQMSFDISLNSSFSDVDNEVNSWESIANSKIAYQFILGGKPRSQYKFIVKSISESDTTFNNQGKRIKTKLAITFEEFVRSGSKPPEKSSSSSAAKAKKKAGGSKTNYSTLVEKSSYKRDNPNATASVQAGPKKVAAPSGVLGSHPIFK